MFIGLRIAYAKEAGKSLTSSHLSFLASAGSFIGNVSCIAFLDGVISLDCDGMVDSMLERIISQACDWLFKSLGMIGSG